MNNPNLPPDDEMILLTNQQALNEFNPNPNKRSGAYSGDRPEGFVGSDKALQVGIDTTKEIEKDAQNAETKYIKKMGIFLGNKDIPDSKKISELTRFIQWTVRMMDNTLIREDENAFKPYKRLNEIAVADLKQRTKKQAN